MYVCIFTHTQMHARAHAYTHTQTHTVFVLKEPCMLAGSWSSSWVVYLCVFRSACTCIYMYAYTCICIHTHKHKHARIWASPVFMHRPILWTVQNLDIFLRSKPSRLSSETIIPVGEPLGLGTNNLNSTMYVCVCKCIVCMCMDDYTSRGTLWSGNEQPEQYNVCVCVYVCVLYVAYGCVCVCAVVHILDTHTRHGRVYVCI